MSTSKKLNEGSDAEIVDSAGISYEQKEKQKEKEHQELSKELGVDGTVDNTIKKLMDNLNDGNYVDVERIIKDALITKIEDRLATLRKDTAKSLFKWGY